MTLSALCSILPGSLHFMYLHFDSPGRNYQLLCRVVDNRVR